MTENTATPSVTFCITELDVGGAEKAMVRIAIGLQEAGWRVRVISLRDAGAMTEPLRAAGIPVTALGCGGFADARALWRLAKELKRNPTDLVQCFLHQANIYGRLAVRFGVRPKRLRPVVVSGIRVADRRSWVILTDRMTRFCSDHYIAVSQHVAATHAELCGLKDDAISFIPNGVEIPTEPVHATDTAFHKLLFVGRLTRQKAPLDLLEAFHLLPDVVRRRCLLNFVGDGPLASSLRTEIDRLRLNDSVHLVGRSNSVPDLMRDSTLLVLPSRWEGMPNVVLEAMAIGLPVLATSIDGTRDIIDDCVTGWLVPPSDPKALSQRIATVLNDSAGCSAIAQAAQAHVTQHFSWQAAIGRYDRLLRDLVAREGENRSGETPF